KRLKNNLTRRLNDHYAFSLEREGNKVFTTYIRTGKMFLIGVAGSKAIAKYVKKEMEQFLISNSFPVRLEKGIEFFHFKKGITFLDYQLKKNNQKIKDKKHPSHFCLLI